MPYAFFAMMNRMRTIDRWSLMRNTDRENIAEHTLQVTMLAHALCLIRERVFAGERPPVDSDLTLRLALYHDAPEIITGDLPTPVKYANPEMHNAYRGLEKLAATSLINLLPPELRADYEPLLQPDADDPRTREALAVVRAADKISAAIKCLEEEKSGNTEFRQAARQLDHTLADIAARMPEVAWFLEHLMPAFAMTLDEMSRLRPE